MIWGIIIEKAIDIGAELLADDEDLDIDNDGDVDAEDVEALIERLEMFASIMGLVAQVDDDVAENEEDQAWELLNNMAFTSVLTDDMLELADLTKKKVKKRLMAKFNEPLSFKKISKYAIDKELEEKFYELACIMVIADGQIDAEEREFLDEFAKALDLIKYDKNSIERKYLKM